MKMLKDEEWLCPRQCGPFKGEAIITRGKDTTIIEVSTSGNAKETAGMGDAVDLVAGALVAGGI
jgi:hypothetical protein